MYFAFTINYIKILKNCYQNGSSSGISLNSLISLGRSFKLEDSMIDPIKCLSNLDLNSSLVNLDSYLGLILPLFMIQKRIVYQIYYKCTFLRKHSKFSVYAISFNILSLVFLSSVLNYHFEY